MLQRSAKKLFTRQEQHNKLRRLRELIPIGFQAQLVHARPHLGGMTTHPFETLLLGRGFMRIQVACQNGLGIDDDLPPTRQLDHHVGTEPFAIDRDGLLLEKIAMRHHAGQLGHALERNLTPLAADGRRAQRLHKVAGLRLQPLLRLGQKLEMLIEASIGRLPRLLQLPELVVVSMQRVLEWLDQTIDRLLLLGKIALGLGLERFERAACQVQKGFVVLFEGFAGESLEGLGQFLSGLAQQSFLFVEMERGLSSLGLRHRAGPRGLRKILPDLIKVKAILSYLSAQFVCQ